MSGEFEELERAVRAAMVDVLKPGGTAVGAGMGAPYSIAGKTGTAQVVGIKQGAKYDEKSVLERHRDHALFVAFAPAEAPRIAVAVMVENGGHGGSTAAPMARAVFALALLAQGRQGPAAREIERAQALVKSPQHVLARMPVMIAAARIRAAGDPTAALASLESIRAESVKRGIARSEFDARRAMANIEGRRSLSAGAKLLDTLRQDAKARGFGLYAR